jgi:hypothetical protein
MPGVAKGEAVELECPFCLRPLFAVSEPQQIIHSRPACAEFEERSAEEVVAAISTVAKN